MIDRIAKLLAVAEGASSRQEAMAFFERAQSLASAHSISLAEAAWHRTDQRAKEEPEQVWITVGERGKHVNRHLVRLMVAITGPNDVKVNIAQDSTHMVLFGLPSDIATCELLWTRISTTMVRLAEDHLRRDDWRTELVWRSKKRDYGVDEEWGMFPVTKQSARASYHEGFATALGARLNQRRRAEVARRTEQEQRARSESDLPGDGDAVGRGDREGAGGKQVNTTALALRSKARAVDDFYQRESTASGTWRGDSRRNSLSRNSYSQGESDARRVALGSESLGTGPRTLPRGLQQARGHIG